MEQKVNYLNVGCGKKFHPNWHNIDMVSFHESVKPYNLIKGLPYPDNKFDVVYHSQVLEHIPKENALFFIKECYRVLKKGGILRVVVPDLENIAREYLKNLDQVTTNPNPMSDANYEWTVIEFYDQTVRNQTGGEMKRFFNNPSIINAEYVIDRGGYEARKVLENMNPNTGKGVKAKIQEYGWKTTIRLAWNKFKSKVGSIFLGKKYTVGDFRLGGEVHMWMYDRYSLGKLLKEAGFSSPLVQTPFKSEIPDWAEYQLDVKGDMIYDPTSLFMEAKK